MTLAIGCINILFINKEEHLMEVIAITESLIITQKPCGKKALFSIAELEPDHPVIKDAMSFRLGYIAAMNQSAANDETNGS
jgi:hypothetical protein